MIVPTIAMSRLSSSKVRGVAGMALRNFRSSISKAATPEAYAR
jgi:hypothetical protein